MKYLDITLALAAKLGSIVVHCDELFSADGHAFDKEAIKSLICEADVTEFVDELRTMGLVPQKRSERA